MKIHFFTKRARNCGSSRQRAFIIAEYLNQKGIKADIHEPSAAEISETHWPQKWSMIWQQVKNLKEIEVGDILFLQRPINNKYVFALLVIYKILFRRKYFFDMDDAVFSYAPSKTKFFTKLSDVIIVGNRNLEAWSKQYNQNVHIIPTCISFEKFQPYTRDYAKKNDKLTIGWIGGGPYHLHNLALLVPALQKLVDQGVPFKFVLVGSLGNQKVYDLFNQVKGLDVQYIDNLDWTNPAAVPSMIQRFDIGVMPLVDNISTQYKCAFKAVEYMACGVVTIVSPIGANADLVQNGVNGFWAANTEAWVDRIKHVYEHPEENAEMGKQAQTRIKNHYSFEVNVDKLIKIFSQST